MSNLVNDLIAQAAVDNPDPLDPCPACNSMRAEAPEGVHDFHSAVKHGDIGLVGKAKWIHNHCWKCGHRPGTNVAVSENALRDAFEKFKTMYDGHITGLAAGDPRASLAPPPVDTSVMDALNEARAEVAELQRQLAVANANKDATPTSEG